MVSIFESIKYKYKGAVRFPVQTIFWFYLLTTIISNSNVIKSRKSTGTTLIVQWIIKLINCNLNFRKRSSINIMKWLWEITEKPESKLSRETKKTFLHKAFITPQRENFNYTTRKQLIDRLNANASSTAISISESPLLGNQNLEADKISPQSKLSSLFTDIQALVKTLDSISKKNKFLKEKLNQSTQAMKRINKTQRELLGKLMGKLYTSIDTKLEAYTQVIHELKEKNYHLNNEVSVH